MKKRTYGRKSLLWLMIACLLCWGVFSELPVRAAEPGDISGEESEAQTQDEAGESAEEEDPFAGGEVLGYEVPFAEGEEERPGGIAEMLTSADQQKAHDRIMAMQSKYPEGMRWTNENFYAWKGGIYSGGYGCAGFAFLLSDAAFDDAPARKIDNVNFSSVRVGDILRVNNNTHSVIITEVADDHVVLAEGNYNSSIHWGRTMTEAQVNAATYMLTRYEDESSGKQYVISIQTYPKTEYLTGEELDLSGGELLVRRAGQSSGGEVIPMTDSSVKADVSKFNSAKPGKYSITLSCKGASVSFKVTVSLRPEDATVIVTGTNADGSEYKDYQVSLADALKALAKADGEYLISVSGKVADKKLTFPAKPKSITIENSTPEGRVSLTSASIAPKCDLVLDCPLECASGKPLSVKAASGIRISIRGEAEGIGSVTGAKGCAVSIETDLALNSLNVTGDLSVAEGYCLNIREKGKCTVGGSAEGKIRLYGKAKGSIAAFGTGELIFCGSAGDLPAVSIEGIREQLRLSIRSAEGTLLPIASGTVVLRTKKMKEEPTEKLIIANSDDGHALKAYLYGKEIRAEIPDLLLLDGKECPGFEKAFRIISEGGEATQHIISLNHDVSLTKWAFPAYSGKLVIEGQGHGISLNGVTSVSPKCGLELTDLGITVRNKKGEIAVLTIKTKNDLILDGVSTDASAVRLKGNAKAMAAVRNSGEIESITGFGTVLFGGEMSLKGKCKTKRLMLKGDAKLTVLTGASLGTAEYKAESGSVIALSEGAKPIGLSASAEGFTELLLADGIAEDSQVMTSKLTNLNEVFTVRGKLGGDTMNVCTLYSKKGKVYVKRADK